VIGQAVIGQALIGQAPIERKLRPKTGREAQIEGAMKPA